MKVYIQSYSSIVAVDTRDTNALNALIPQMRNRITKAIEPEYKAMVPPAMLRRMSRIIKMGMHSALDALQNANIQSPDAIITGTGLGCFEDTDKFLLQIGEQNESMLAPTSFIQSTHNTVAGQIALQLKCNAYNFTYVHQGLSFESALLDSFLKIKTQDASVVLCGYGDEVNNAYIELLDRAGHLVKEEHVSFNLSEKQDGICLGEGSGFFVIGNKKNDNSIEVKALELIPFPENENLLFSRIEKLCRQNSIEVHDIDCLVLGNNGDEKQDSVINALNKKLNRPYVYYKNLCGEFFTASGFALHFACEIINNRVNKNYFINSINSEYNRILIVNHYWGQEYSLILLEK
jgi:hypothetical protein